MQKRRANSTGSPIGTISALTIASNRAAMIVPELNPEMHIGICEQVSRLFCCRFFVKPPTSRNAAPTAFTA